MLHRPFRALTGALLLAALAAVPASAATPTGGAAYGPARAAQSVPAAPAPAPTPAPAAGGATPVAPVAPPAPTATATLVGDGTAVAPAGAPAAVVAAIAAANRIATLPYRYGGGHRRWTDTGYDCSGSVSFALRGAELLDTPLTSGDLERWGVAGPGQWITVYANADHTFMVVAGLRFDTSGQRRTGSRWQPMDRSTAGFVARHPDAL
jgi:cell wall-associated NlpC family hydrolase